MKRFDWRVALGVVLVILGVVAFLQSSNLITLQGDWWGLAFALIFAVVGASFLYTLAANPQGSWWAVIPGLTLVGLGATIGLALIPGFPGTIVGTIFMGSIAASFWVIYFVKRFWWAIIPAGVLTTIAVIILFPDEGNLVGSLLFLGMAATFALLGFIEIEGRRLSWPWIPAGVLALMGVLIGLTTSGISAIVWAVLLILAGAFLVARPYLMKK